MTSLPDLVDQWTENILQLKESTRILEMSNALLIIENQILSDQQNVFKEKAFTLSRQLADLNLPRKKLKLEREQKRKDLSSLSAKMIKMEEEVYFFQAENKNLKDALALQTIEIPKPKNLMTSPKMESLRVIIEEFAQEKKVLRSELLRLTQALSQLNQQKTNIEKILKKK
jgi:hypothetical protein